MAWIDSIRISTTAARIALSPGGHEAGAVSVAALEDGGFAALWHGRAGVSASFNLSLARLGVDGALQNPVRDLGIVPRSGATGKGIDIAALSGGGYALFYDDTRTSIYEIPNAVQTRALLTSSILGRRYDATDTELEQDFTVTGSFSYTFDGQTRSVSTIGQFDTYGVTALPALQTQAVVRGAPSLAASADGGHWLAHVTGGNIQVLRYAGTDITTPDMRPLPGATANIVQSDLQSVPQIAELSDGGAVVVWQNGVSGTAIRGRILNADGTTRLDLDIAAASGPNERAPQVAALANGRFVVVWTEVRADFSDSEIMARLYAANGQPEGVAFRVNTITNSFQSDPDVAALPDGGFAVVWQSLDAFNTQYDVKLRRFAEDGTPVNDRFLGGEWDVFPDSNSQIRPSISVGADGQMIIGFLDFGRLQANGAFGVAAARLYQVEAAADIVGTGGNDVITAPAAGGTAMLLSGNDLFNGGAGADLVRGNAGNDTLYGAGGNDWLGGDEGNDVLYGGDGTDTLIGGDGDDFLYGGASEADLRDVIFGGDGNDFIDGGWGNDELNGGEGNDTITGGFGADTVIGNAGDDVLLGAAGSDQISGGPGDDFINGGWGFDRINGGTGADRFFHAGVRDHGSDWIQDYTAAEGDVLVFGLAGATRQQFQINTNFTPNAGQAAVAEAFVIYRPTGQILWALVDGAGQSSINLQLGGQVFDLMA